MPPAARLTDMHTCPMATPIPPAPAAIPHVGGPIMPPCFPQVLIGGLPAARVGDQGMCIPVGTPDPIVKGSATVMIGGMPAARMGDTCSHGGAIVVGCPTVLIGDSSGGGGGAPGAGQGQSGSAPGDLKSLSPLASGQAMSAPKVQKQALQAAAQSGAPFCEVCQKMKEEEEAAAAKPKPKPRKSPNRPSNFREDLPDDSFDDNGDLIWPKDDGFDGTPRKDVIEAGWQVDRYSTQVGEKDRGRFLSPEGTPYGMRALPYDASKMHHTVYRVLKDIPAKIGDIAPAFGEPGGGTQYLTDMSVGDLVKGGYLEMIQP